MNASALSLGLTTLALSFILVAVYPQVEYVKALVYALPLSIMSSAIIIPSVANLSNYKREFMIYESTFSSLIAYYHTNVWFVIAAGKKPKSPVIDNSVAGELNSDNMEFVEACTQDNT
ncbi:MAG: hypothetical protein ACK5HT_12755 [Draconibacterium sp.]